MLYVCMSLLEILTEKCPRTPSLPMYMLALSQKCKLAKGTLFNHRTMAEECIFGQKLALIIPQTLIKH
jgi:hypothetical protein